MNTNELRLGNWIWSTHGKYDRVECQVTAIHLGYVNTSYDNSQSDLRYIESIPLTEEWLLKFGFENWDRGSWANKLSLHKQDGLFWCQTYHGNEMCIEHVHQLQNLYFALTGEELKIKEQ